ncbi:MAG: zf-HC2 domain-containing protein [Oscillospiraceae bacterium]|nr:zf-HC2 domain-containing protein [Oscillospiraceae bacterium]
MKELTCEMIRDLMPLCAEGLCSEESRKAVEEHIASCEACRRLYEQPAEAVEAVPVPDEGTAMKKVSRKMKHSKIKVVLLSIAAGLLALVLIVLSVGQVVKRDPIPSFETVAQTINVYPLVRMLTSKDYEGYVLHAANVLTDSLNEARYLQTESAQDVQLLSEAYEAAYGDTTVKSIRIRSAYSDELSLKGNSRVVISHAVIHYANGDMLDLELERDIDGLYRCEMTGSSGEGKEKLFNALRFIANHKLIIGSVVEVLMTAPTPYTEDPDLMERLPGRCKFITNSGRFSQDCAEQIAGQLQSFYEKGYTVPVCNLSEVQYDKETHELYYWIHVTASDSEGTAMLCSKMPFTYEGLHPQTEVCVYRDGCGEELAADLETLFQ